MLSKEAKELLSKYPDVCKEISDAHSSLWFLDVKNKTMDELWNEFLNQNTEQKEWEIVSFLFAGVEEWRRTDYLNNYSAGGTVEFDLQYLLSNTNYKIHSVKRLSDGEVFSVVDKVEEFGKIFGFEIMGGNSLHAKCGFTDERTFLPHISNIKKSKPCLFVTEDGVEIVANDSCFEVTKDFRIYQSSYYENANPNHTSKYFSIREKAEEYILLNKPCLSLKEIKQILINHPFFGEYENALHHLARKKLTHAN